MSIPNTTSDLVAALRPSSAALPESRIVTVFNHGRNKPGLIPLWAGEGDLQTPAFIAEAASRALLGGDTFYTYQRGIPELREAIAAYHTRHYGRPFAAENFFVTGGGMQAIQLAFQMTVGVGDEVLVPTPAWPNFRGAAEIQGARITSVPMRLEPTGWRLDLDQLIAAAGPRTRVIVINSPAIPAAGPPARVISRRSSHLHANAACGSSPTRSITASISPVGSRQACSTSSSPRIACCSPRHFQKTGP